MSRGDECAGISGDGLRRGIAGLKQHGGCVDGENDAEDGPAGLGGAGAEVDGAAMLFSKAARDP